MIRTLIVDDEPLPRERIRTLLRDHRNIEVIGECGDGREAVKTILSERPDLIFLDVQMPELDGFEVIESIGNDFLPAVIFVTAFDKYAIRAFDVSAMDYLLKPISPERFNRALERFAERRRPGSPYPTRFIARTGSKLLFIRVSDVDWIDGADNYVRLHVGGREHFVRDTLKSIERQLDPTIFVRVHRSTIVNLERLDTMKTHDHGEYVLTMKDGAKLTTSRTYSDRFRALLRNHSFHTPL